MSESWGKTAQTHRHLLVFPAWACDLSHQPGGPNTWYWLSLFAARNDLTINEYYSPRFSSSALDYYCREQPDQVFRDGPQPDTAVVLNRSDTLKLTLRDGNQHYCRDVDGVILCTYDPERAEKSLNRFKNLLRPVAVGEELILASEDPRFLESGFSWWENTERWTQGYDTNILFWFNVIPDGNAKLTLRFNRKLVTEKYPVQAVEISLNGRFLGTAELRADDPQMTWEFALPSKTIFPGEVARLEFRLPNAITPHALGMNSDTRVLGIGLQSIRVSVD